MNAVYSAVECGEKKTPSDVFFTLSFVLDSYYRRDLKKMEREREWQTIKERKLERKK
jgi:hypothetical protein